MDDRCPTCDKTGCQVRSLAMTPWEMAQSKPAALKKKRRLEEAQAECKRNVVNWRDRALMLDRIFERLREMHPGMRPQFHIIQGDDGIRASAAMDVEDDGPFYASDLYLNPTAAIAELAAKLKKGS